MTLKEKFPDIEFLTAKEAIDKNNWTYDENETKFENIKCCEQSVEINSLLGVNYAYCEKCGKMIQDITGIHVTSNSTCGMLNLDDVDLEKEEKLWYIPKRKEQ